MKIIFCFLGFLIFCISTDSFPQSISDSINRPIQFRRGTEIPSGYQSYEEKYSGKNFLEEKRRLYPIDQITSGTGVWTELNPKVPRVDYLGIFFVNVDTGWACGDLGTVIKTTDGGQTWNTLETNTTAPILKVRSFDGQIVIASGFGGMILRSTDGGESWLQVTSNVAGDLWGLQMINDSLGWACGNDNSLTKTTDGGLTWQAETIPGYDSDLWWIDFMNEEYGFISGNPGQVFKTTDGGENWQIIQTSVYTPLYSLDLIDSLHIAAAGYGGNHVYSSDGGESWEATPLYGLPNDDINCVKYIDIDTGYVLMLWDGMLKTTNRGESWQTVADIGEYELQFFTEGPTGYNAGTGLKIDKAEGDLDIWRKAILNDNFSDVFFTSEQKGFVLSGSLYGTINGGTDWEKVQGAPGGNDLLFLDSLTGFLGASSSIYKTTDGGDNWYATQGAFGARKIFFINQTTGWAIYSNVIYKTTDRGENWFEQASASYDYYTSIFFVDSLNGWATSRYIWQTTDGGENWVERMDIQINFADDIYFIGPIGFIIEFLDLYKSTNFGSDWILQLNSQYIIRKFGWLTDKHGFIIGDGVFETVDSGETWIEQLELRNIGLTRFQANQNYLGYASGKLGLIYQYIDTTLVPVELTSFHGKEDNGVIRLNWITSTETNNKGFVVERSTIKGQQTNWGMIGFVKGNGTTTLPQIYSYVDKNVVTNKYKYRLMQLDYDGSYEYSKEIEVIVSTSFEFSLYQNYPNPFNPTTKISFNLAEDSKVKLKIFDVLGSEIQTIINKELKAGYYDLDFTAARLTSGVYFYQLKAEGDNGEHFNSIKKMVLIK